MQLSFLWEVYQVTVYLFIPGLACQVLQECCLLKSGTMICRLLLSFRLVTAALQG